MNAAGGLLHNRNDSDEGSNSSKQNKNISAAGDVVEQSLVSPLLPLQQPTEQHGLSCTSPVVAATLLYDALHGEPHGPSSLLERTLFASATALVEPEPQSSTASPMATVAYSPDVCTTHGKEAAWAVLASRASPTVPHQTAYTETNVSVSSRPGCSTALEHDTRTDTTSYLTMNAAAAVPLFSTRDRSPSNASYSVHTASVARVAHAPHAAEATAQSQDYSPPWLAQYVLPPRPRPNAEVRPVCPLVLHRSAAPASPPPPPPLSLTTSPTIMGITDTLMSEWWWRDASPSLPHEQNLTTTTTTTTVNNNNAAEGEGRDAARLLWYTSPSPPARRTFTDTAPHSLPLSGVMSPSSDNVPVNKQDNTRKGTSGVKNAEGKANTCKAAYTNVLAEPRQSSSPPARHVPDRRARLEGWVAQSPREAAERRRRSMSADNTQSNINTGIAHGTVSVIGSHAIGHTSSLVGPVCDITNTPERRHEAAMRNKKTRSSAALLTLRQMMQQDTASSRT